MKSLNTKLALAFLKMLNIINMGIVKDIFSKKELHLFQ